MEVENYFEIIEAGKSATISTVDGFNLDFVNIALSRTNDLQNKVTIHVVMNSNKYLLCVLSEAAGIYQIPTNLEINSDSNVIFEVRGKGTVTLSGITYRNDLADEMEEESEGMEEDN
ncbi:Nucleoplasmin-like domain-containing protein [Entamoeba marina]